MEDNRLVFSPPEIEFAPTRIGAEVLCDVELDNTGSDPVELDSMTEMPEVAGSRFAVYGLMSGDLLEPGRVLKLQIGFRPRRAGEADATLWLMGRQGSPLASLRAHGRALAAPEQNRQDAGAEAAGNPATASPDSDVIAWLGGGSAAFGVGQKPPSGANAAAGDSCQTMTETMKAIGVDPDLLGSSCDGVAAQPANMSKAPELELDPQFIDFPPTEVGQRSQVRTLSVTNLGDEPVTLDGIARSDGSVPRYLLCEGARSLEPRATASLALTFVPNVEAEFADDICVMAGGAASLDRVAITGTARRSTAGSDAAVVDFVMAQKVLDAIFLVFEGAEDVTGPPPFDHAIELLVRGYQGKVEWPAGGVQIVPVDERLRDLDQSVQLLQPVISFYQRDGIDRKILGPIDRMRAKISGGVAMDAMRDRVGAAVRVGDHVVEVPDAALSAETAAQYADVLAPTIDKLVVSSTVISEQLVRLKHKQLEELFKDMRELKGPGLQEIGRGSLHSPTFLTDVLSVLMAAKGKLAFGHAIDEAHKAHGATKVAAYVHSVQSAIEMVGGVTTLMASIAAGIAKQMHRFSLAAQLRGVAGEVLLKLGLIISGVELIHSVVTLFNPNASLDEKVDAAVAGAGALTWIVAAEAGESVAGGLITAGLTGVYLHQKLFVASYTLVAARLVGPGLVSLFQSVADSANTIAQRMEFLIKAGLMLEQEKDPEKRRLLGSVVKDATQSLDQGVNGFLAECENPGFSSSSLPGINPHLRAALAPVLPLKSVEAKSPEQALRKARAVLERIQWTFDNAENIFRESMGLEPRDLSHDRPDDGARGERGSLPRHQD